MSTTTYNVIRTGTACMFLMLILVWPQPARADEIAIWNFNDSDLIVDHGSGALTTNFNLANVVFTLGGSSINARLGDPAGQSLTLQGGTSNANNGRNLTFSLSTVVSTLTLPLRRKHDPGFNTPVSYSLDVTFVNFAAPTRRPQRSVFTLTRQHRRPE